MSSRHTFVMSPGGRRWPLGPLLIATLAASACAGGKERGAQALRPQGPELEYLKAVNRAGPPSDPQLLFLLMAQFANANQHEEGAQMLSSLMGEFRQRLTDPQRALYLAAIGALRAGHAPRVPLLSRIGWVNQTISLLEEARRLSGNDLFVVRWMIAVVYAQLPARFHKQDVAMADLLWCVDNATSAPHSNWLREVYYHLAVLHRDRRRDGDAARAEDYLRRSGFDHFGKAFVLTAPSAEQPETGHAFVPPTITEPVPGRIYALSGFEFTEYYFVVSDDGQQLIAIDAGTRPDSAQAAYQALRRHSPHLPPLTTVLVTHAHWDHVGGHRFFRALNPGLKMYARANYREELDKTARAPDWFLKSFFGTRFNMDDVLSFRADATVDRRTELKIGGTRVQLIPVEGGETHDALFVHLPDHATLFVGDFIMPYLGAPFVEEGSFSGLLSAIDEVVALRPRHLLHGHEPLTRNFGSPARLGVLKGHLAWLEAQVAAGIRANTDRAALQQANLIPPGLLADPAMHLPYLILRENLINRLYDQSVGYWQADLQGLDSLSRADRGALLVDYLGVSERQLANTVDSLIADGRHELAATVLDWTKGRFPDSSRLKERERLVYLKLSEKYQEFNPFKLIIYSGRAGLKLRHAREGGGGDRGRQGTPSQGRNGRLQSAP